MFNDIGLLILRLFIGLSMLAAHGWPKLLAFSDKMGSFPDPLGVGSTISLCLVIFSEVFCALLISIGLLTRLASIPYAITMAVAFFLVHHADAFHKKELAFIYLGASICLAFTGAGKLSIDHYVLKKK